MAEWESEKLLRKYRILVAPLDWGLGHATRCIPVIGELLSNDCDVWLAGEGMQESLLRSEFPALPFLSLSGYNIRYSKSSGGFALKISSQIPRIIFEIGREHRWLNRMVRSHGFDAVISDNRFGLYNQKIQSVFMTHQLHIKTPLGKWSENILQQWNYKYINRFTECWVPDYAGEINLAGHLSHPDHKPNIPIKYLGCLSRLEIGDRKEVNDHLLFILSGPEPQRTIFEDKIIDQISHYPGTATIVRGLPSSSSIVPSTGMIKFYNHLPAKELKEEFNKAEWIISRSGYSTIMDIVKLKKKSILVPTPGQTEQEYLAEYLAEKRIACIIGQNAFSVSDALSKARQFDYWPIELPNSNDLGFTIKALLKSLSTKKSKL